MVAWNEVTTKNFIFPHTYYGVCVCICAVAWVWKSETNLWESVLSVYTLGAELPLSGVATSTISPTLIFLNCRIKFHRVYVLAQHLFVSIDGHVGRFHFLHTVNSAALTWKWKCLRGNI